MSGSCTKSPHWAGPEAVQGVRGPPRTSSIAAEVITLNQLFEHAIEPSRSGTRHPVMLANVNGAYGTGTGCDTALSALPYAQLATRIEEARYYLQLKLLAVGIA